MEIKIGGKHYFFPQKIWKDKTKTVAEIEEALEPLKIHQVKSEIKDIEAGIAHWEAEPDEIVSSNEEKFTYLNNLRAELKRLNKKLERLEGK